MTVPGLSKKERDRLRRTSALPIERYFASLLDADKRTTWLKASNRYRVVCTKQYRNDLKAKPGTVDHAAMCEYVAASAPTHVIDGWSLLGRAVDALLRRDAYGAVHLAYYAELRAAMSLLASEGIGILDRRHPRASKVGRTSSFSQQGTHNVVWPCLQHWAACQSSFNLIEQIFRPASLPLSAWLAGLGATTPARAVARQVFRAWGLDLKTFPEDHDLRNLASYRPSEFRLPAATPLVELLGFVNELWACFEPEASGRFPNIERLLLRRALRVAGIQTVSLHGLGTLGMPSMEANVWMTAINASTEPSILRNADRRSSLEDAACHLGVISRAALLLVVALAAARRLLVGGGYTSEHLEFWWRRYGVDRGFWDDTSVPSDPIEAWADIKDHLDALEEWRSQNPRETSLRSWRRKQSSVVETAGAFELVAIWGLMP
jgi:hypothetical protein